ncbi:hypothetical protein [Tenuifilum osseticum]|uniref:hypothetical protein n=1 Tax=Tenuifilum osseticum TaxID=3374723 RepID=UPI0034E5D205
MAKSGLHVLSCLDTRKNQRKSRLKSPTRWVPRGWNCHAILFATPEACLMWYRLQKPTATFHPRPIAGSGFYAFACFFRSISPPPRSTPDPLPGQAFMPLPASSAPFPLREKGWGEVSFPIFNLDDPSKFPLRGETLALQ